MNNIMLLCLLNILHFSVGNQATFTYFPFNNQINSVYGTGNKLADIVYRSYCNTICETSCCGNDVNYTNMTCLDITECNTLITQYQLSFIVLLLCVYSSIVCFVVVIVFIIFVLLTKNKEYAWKNAFAGALLVLCSCCALPVVIIWIIAYKQKTTLFNVLGGRYDPKELNEISSDIDRKSLEINNKFKVKRSSAPEQKNKGSDSIRIIKKKENNEDIKIQGKQLVEEEFKPE